MLSWLPDLSNSPRLQLGLTAAISAGAAISITIGLQNVRRTHTVQELKQSIPSLTEKHDIEKINDFGGAEVDSTAAREDDHGTALARRARLGDYDEALILEQLARNRVFLTDDGLVKLRNAFVVVVGCGGVGSHAAAALARSGCGKLRLIDFDQVTLSSLNRHAVATLADVGTPKVACLQKRLEQIVPWTHFDCRNQLFSEDVAKDQLEPWKDGQQPTYVIDAIDNIDSKVALLHFCRTNGLPVICSMGAGCKSDPTRVFISDISASTDDPLSRATRRKLRLRGVKDGIPVVFSDEKTGPGKAQLLPLPEDEFKKGSVGELGVLPDFRVRILPVLGTMPAIFGLCVANHIMLDIAGYPHDYVPSKGRDKTYDAIHAQLQGFEERLAKRSGIDSIGLRIPLSSDDVGYITDEIYRGRSVVSGLTTRLALIRWRKPDGEWISTATPGQKADRLSFDQLVCMTRDEATQHEKQILHGDKTPEDIYDESVLKLVAQRMEEERGYRVLR
ncbi:hypothetical protein AMS68_006831 [Peltaster fructicola]|uniref:THIF-type NAD/FAD binding fold domain-containing protein n=1 Tax=Peltaster fructicola TaxID=286661 RepID=A0A6H0Y2S8_9PEZI|nr:hypothetical protein AMS68_006831 [Peltaster fructicola]